jgi:cytochrome P450
MLVLKRQGGDTTATTMAAAFFYLSRSPDAYAKLTTEIRTAFSSGADICAGERLSSCTYLRAVIDEAMRISPPVSGTLWRELPPGDADSDRPLIVDGHEIPAGVWVGVNMYAIHHNEEYFPEPFAFKPERWLQEESSPNKGGTPHTQKDVFSAFGRGPRSCVGKAMAYMEANLVLAKTLWYFDVERPSDPAFDNIGGGQLGDSTGRGRPGEFQIYDQFIADHHGPCLLFKARAGLCDDIQ